MRKTITMFQNTPVAFR